jgi:hypothetical protein
VRYGGTGFFVSHPDRLQFPYLVTAKHVAEALPMPFVLGVNDDQGVSDTCEIDNIRWYCHPDSNVDVAIAQFGLYGADSQTFSTQLFADKDDRA